MKKLNLVAVLAVALTFVVVGRASAATATANAVAQIAAAISITKTDDLDFGQVVPSVDPGTVTVPLVGDRTVGGGVTLGNAGSAGPATFDVAGEPNATYDITLPAPFNLTGPGDPMLVDGFTCSPGSTGTLNGGGTQALSVGGTLHVGANQAAGSYSAVFDVVVAYN